MGVNSVTSLTTCSKSINSTTSETVSEVTSEITSDTTSEITSEITSETIGKTKPRFTSPIWDLFFLLKEKQSVSLLIHINI